MQTILYHAKLYVARGDFRSALCAEDGIIRAVGSDAEILALARPGCRRIDCEGRAVVPGFNDSHIHLMQLAQTRYEAPISGARSVDELIARCREFLANHPERTESGLHAIGWNQDDFPDGRLPDRHDLDRISTAVPVVLERVCGHIVSANTLATQRFAACPEFSQCPPDEVLRASDGTLCGIFRGNACNFVKAQIPAFTREQHRDMLREAMNYAASLGLTSVQSNDVGTSVEDADLAFSLLREIYAAGGAPIRYRHQVCFHDLAAFRESLLHGEYSRRSQYDGFLTLGPLKLFQDGSLGARTAMLRGGYPGEPDNHGLAWTTREDMAAFCGLASEHGIQVVTHAIGDEAIAGCVHKEALGLGGEVQLQVFALGVHLHGVGGGGGQGEEGKDVGVAAFINGLAVQSHGEGVLWTEALAVFQLEDSAAGHGTDERQVHFYSLLSYLRRFAACPQRAGMVHWG